MQSDRPETAVDGWSEHGIMVTQNSKGTFNMAWHNVRNVRPDDENRSAGRHSEDPFQAISKISTSLRPKCEFRRPALWIRHGPVGTDRKHGFPARVISDPPDKSVQLVPVPPERADHADVLPQARLDATALGRLCHDDQLAAHAK